jgi:plasmid maintenance system antidote protein VapI
MAQTKRLLTESDIVNDLRTRAMSTSQRDIARKLAMSPQFICDVLQGRRSVTESLARQMGYSRQVFYERSK